MTNVLHVIGDDATDVYAVKDTGAHAALWVSAYVYWVADLPGSGDASGAFYAFNTADGDGSGHNAWVSNAPPRGLDISAGFNGPYAVPVNTGAWRLIEFWGEKGNPADTELWVDGVQQSVTTFSVNLPLDTLGVSFGSLFPGGWETGYELYIGEIRIGSTRGAGDIWDGDISAGIGAFDAANPGSGTLEVIPDPTGTLPSRELAGIMWLAAAPSGELDLPLQEWYGGPSYWSVAESGDQMLYAENNGWDQDSFFPIAVWLSDPAHASDLAAIGVNTYLGIFHNVNAIDTAAAAGMFIIPQSNEWTEAEVAAEVPGRDNVVGWLPHDEPDLNVAFATYMGEVQDVRDYDDGRFVLTNFAHGIRRTVYYSGSTGGGTSTEMHDAVGANDAACVDQYCYTSPGIRGDVGPQGIVDNANFPTLWDGTSYLWPGDYQDFAKAKQAAAYGWQAVALSSLYTDKGLNRPVWIAVETKMPYLAEANRTIILYEQIRGAVWSAIVNGANGILYFQHNGFYGAPGTTDPGSYPSIDPNTGVAPDTGTMSLVDCEPELPEYVGELNAQIASLAPVLNTQSYVFDFGASGIETMLKARGGFAYIFATKSVLGTTGSKTFTLTGSGISGTDVEVVDEARSLTVTAGAFTDSFANEYSQHIYKIAI